MFYRHFLDVEGVECCGADDHLQAFAVRCRFWYLFIDAFDEIAVACRQQPILQEELKLTHDVTCNSQCSFVSHEMEQVRTRIKRFSCLLVPRDFDGFTLNKIKDSNGVCRATQGPLKYISNISDFTLRKWFTFC